MKSKPIYAISNDGTRLDSRVSYQAYREANHNAFVVKKGDNVTIKKQNLLSYGTQGVVIGFDISSSGKALLLISWNHLAAPLRVGIEAVMPTAPNKFWMVIPLNPDHVDAARPQDFTYNSASRRHGIAPAIRRYLSKEAADRYVAAERDATGFNHYVVLESIEFNTNGVALPIV